MIRKVWGLLAASLLASGSAAGSLDDVPRFIEWSIAPSTSAGATQDLRITLRTRHNNDATGMSTNAIAAADLVGLDQGALASAGQPVSFRLVREAGALACEGIAGRQRGTGDCRLEPNRAFGTALSRRGIGQPTDGQLFYMTIQNVRMELVETLERAGYGKPTMDELVEAGLHGVRPAYIREMSGLGYRPETIRGLIKMRIHGVTADRVREFAAAGVKPDLDTLLALSIHDVRPAYVREMQKLGYGPVDLRKVVRLRIHGVTSDYVREMRQLGYGDAGIDAIAQMRILGVTPDFVRKANARAGTRLSPGELIDRKVTGRS